MIILVFWCIISWFEKNWISVCVPDSLRKVELSSPCLEKVVVIPNDEIQSVQPAVPPAPSPDSPSSQTSDSGMFLFVCLFFARL